MILLATGLFCSPLLFGQTTDSTAVATPTEQTSSEDQPAVVVAEDTLMGKSPAKAALYSALLPGLGQAYNGKYWKIPIVYAGMGTSIFFILDNRKNYIDFRDAYIAEIDSCPETVSTLNPLFTTTALRERADQYRQWMELSYIITAGIYVLNIVDASVDAHLSTFDVSDDLSLRVMPGVFPTMVGSDRMYMGVNLRLNFKR
ncbi:MAG: DUF5683 domain-containing protein [Salibacteraceae bacterium]